MKLTKEQLDSLRKAYDLISDVQVDMYKQDFEGGDWQTLFSIRSKLGFENARLSRENGNI
jgi:hypothetical protein